MSTPDVAASIATAKAKIAAQIAAARINQQLAAKHGTAGPLPQPPPPPVQTFTQPAATVAATGTAGGSRWGGQAPVTAAPTPSFATNFTPAPTAATTATTTTDPATAWPVGGTASTPVWPWARSSDRAEASALVATQKVDDPTVAKDYTALTQNGLRKIGYAGGPVLSDKEAAGIKFGLHRQSFKPINAPKTLNLLVGMEVSVALQLNFPLLDRIRGPNNTYLLHIMRQCPTTLVVLQGRGTPLEVSEPLHLRISGSDPASVDTAKAWADNLILSVRQDFDAALKQSQVTAAAPAVIPGAVGFTATGDATAATQYTYSSSYHQTVPTASGAGMVPPPPPPPPLPYAVGAASSSSSSSSSSSPSPPPTSASTSTSTSTSSDPKRPRDDADADANGEDTRDAKRVRTDTITTSTTTTPTTTAPSDEYDPEADALSSDDDGRNTHSHILSHTHMLHSHIHTLRTLWFRQLALYAYH